MTDVRVRGLDESVVRQLKAQAKRNGHTFQEELKEVLAEAASRPRRELVAGLRAFHEGMRSRIGELPDSTPLIRDERDQWG